MTEAAGKPATRRRRFIIAGVLVAVLVALAVPGFTVLLPWWSDANAAPVRVRVAAGTAHTCAITADQTVKCWGANASGQLGIGTTEQANAPVSIVAPNEVVSLAAGGDHTCALTASGRVYCWGANGSGQLGDGTTDDRAEPALVEGLSKVLAIAASDTHTCALLTDRSVRCWGANGSGQLGTGDTADSAVPMPVKDLPARVTSVAAGNGYTCVVFTGRTVRCWGDNSDGQLGLGDLTPRLRWEPVIGLPRTSFVSTGDVHACAVTQDGVVYCWGSNASGQLGTTMAAASAAAPMAVPGLTGRFTAVAAGRDRTCALASTADVWCWGGEQTDASADPSVARPVPSLAGVRGLAIGAFHACADTSSGVYCWGRNDSGQLGAPATGTDPVAVPGV